MERVQFGRWVVLANRAATERAYAAIAEQRAYESAPRFDELEYRNWEAVRKQAVPEDFRLLLSKLGIDARFPAELYDAGQRDSGLHAYVGRYHFIGEIEEGGDSLQPVEAGGCTFRPEPVGVDLVAGFTQHCILVPEEFRDLPLVEIMFIADVPWVIDGP